MSDDYSQRVIDLLPEDVLKRYFEIRQLISVRREELSNLRFELIEIARAYGIPGIDNPTSGSNERIRRALNGCAVEINSNWASVGEDWSCPCCRRTKPECARLGSKGQMIGKLVAHHDHIEDFMSVVLGELSKDVSIEALSAGDALSFIRRGVPLFTRFDRVVICEDCNNAESTGKRLVGADRYFTFTPKEIAAFLRMSPNTAHSLDESALGEIYASAQRHYDLRIAAIKKLAERAFKGTAWYEPVEFGDREEQVDRRAQLALKLFGLDDVGLRAVRDIFLTTEKIAAEHASAWRTKKSVPSRAPSEQEIEFVTRGNVKFESLPEGWRCPCCMRSKRDVIRWSHNSKKFMFVVVTRKVPEATARFGTRQITLCDACNHIFQEVYKELRVASGNVSVPDDLIDLDDVRAVIAPAAHSLHDVKSDAAQMLVSKCLPLLEVE